MQLKILLDGAIDGTARTDLGSGRGWHIHLPFLPKGFPFHPQRPIIVLPVLVRSRETESLCEIFVLPPLSHIHWSGKDDHSSDNNNLELGSGPPLVCGKGGGVILDGLPAVAAIRTIFCSLDVTVMDSDGTRVKTLVSGTVSCSGHQYGGIVRRVSEKVSVGRMCIPIRGKCQDRPVERDTTHSIGIHGGTIRVSVGWSDDQGRSIAESSVGVLGGFQ